MSPSSARLESGGLIDRSIALNFTFNGKPYRGYQGDTLASALIANGISLTARSFRYHRPRGIFSAGVEECHAIVCVGEGASREPNVRATQQILYEGLIARSQNAWPSVRYDLGALTGWLSRFLPTGFYYKSFQWPAWKWHEGWIRRLAGVAPAPIGPDPDRYEKRHAHCDLLIIGAGPSGLAAAMAAATSGLRIILADDQPEPGGSLLWNKEYIEGGDAVAWARQISMQLKAMPNVSLLRNTTVIAAWDHGYFSASQQLDGVGLEGTSQCLWKIRTQHTILASGAIERPLVFPNNDRPGIMLASAARHYLNRYAAKPGKRAVIYTNNNSAYDAVTDLLEAGIAVIAIVDVREVIPEALLKRATAQGIRICINHELYDTTGYLRLRKVRIRPILAGSISGKPDLYRRQRGNPGIDLGCDLLCVSGGWNPTLHLYSQAGGKLVYQDELACFVPSDKPSYQTEQIHTVGSAHACFDLAGCLESGYLAGLDAVATLAGATPLSSEAPLATDDDLPYAISPYWRTSQPCNGRQWVDYLHDVSCSSIDVAILEGFTSAEHLKRYTTIGMAIDQGKTSNVNALGILAQASGQKMGQAGTTSFRPPYVPVRLGTLAGRETGIRAWPQRKLPLHHWHIQAAGVMENHSGWLRPACYRHSGESEADAISREVFAARHGVTLFDSSSLGKIEVRGPDAMQFLNRMYINNVETLKTGRIRYGMMLNENGIIMDDGVFARLQDDFFLVSSSSAGTAEVIMAFEEWLQTEWPELDVLVHNATTQWATLTVSGPKARPVLAALLPDVDLSPEQFPHMSLRTGRIDGLPYRLMRVSFTGEVSFEFNVPADYAMAAWQKLLEAGKPFNITPLGMEALDVLRIEKGFLEVRVDTDPSTTALDVGWAPAIARKAGDFVGRRSLARPNDQRRDRLQLVGLMPSDPGKFIPVGSHIVSEGNRRPQGHVTSSCYSPTLGRSIAMALLESGQTRTRERIVIDVDSSLHVAEVVPISFYDPKCERLND